MSYSCNKCESMETDTRIEMRGEMHTRDPYLVIKCNSCGNERSRRAY